MIGPSIPEHLLKRKEEESARPAQPPADDDSSDDDYGPALPPDLESKAPKRVVGPSYPIGPPPEPESDDEDAVGPLPLPPGHEGEERNGVEEFLEREERRRKAEEEASKPKALKREEWMLAPPTESNILGSLDPTKLRPRQFQKTAKERVVDSTLWTETPAEKQQRLADEVSGKRKRVENASVSAEEEAEARRKKRRDEEIRAQVDTHNKQRRGESLLDMHSKASGVTAKGDAEKGPPAIWDRDRDMSLGGKLMDERSRNALVKDAKGLSSKFGHASTGNYL